MFLRTPGFCVHTRLKDLANDTKTTCLRYTDRLAALSRTSESPSCSATSQISWRAPAAFPPVAGRMSRACDVARWQIPNLMPMLLRDGELFWNPTARAAQMRSEKWRSPRSGMKWDVPTEVVPHDRQRK